MDNPTALAHLLATAGAAPGCVYGHAPSDWAPVALALAEVYADSSGDPLDAAGLDSAAAVVVNDGDGRAARIIWEGRHAVSLEPREIIPADVLAEALHALAMAAWEEEGSVTQAVALAALDAHAGTAPTAEVWDHGTGNVARAYGPSVAVVVTLNGKADGASSPSGRLMLAHAVSRLVADGEAVDAFHDLSDAVDAFLSAEVSS